MKQKGLFFILNDKMITCKIAAISIVDKWAPYSIKYPQFQKWEEIVQDFKKDAPKGL
jgi:hypothetical protein